MNAFLVIFQMEAPMLPFLSDTVEVLLRRIMSYFVTAPVLENAATALALIKLDVTAVSGKCLPTSRNKISDYIKIVIQESEIDSWAKGILSERIL